MKTALLSILLSVVSQRQ